MSISNALMRGALTPYVLLSHEPVLGSLSLLSSSLCLDLFLSLFFDFLSACFLLSRIVLREAWHSHINVWKHGSARTQASLWEDRAQLAQVLRQLCPRRYHWYVSSLLVTGVR